MNSRGFEVSINIIVVAALALIGMVIVGSFFLGGSSNLFGKIATTQEQSGADDTSIAISSCTLACAQTRGSGQPSIYCNKIVEHEGSDKHCYESPIYHVCKLDIDDDDEPDELDSTICAGYQS